MCRDDVKILSGPCSQSTPSPRVALDSHSSYATMCTKIWRLKTSLKFTVFNVRSSKWMIVWLF